MTPRTTTAVVLRAVLIVLAVVATLWLLWLLRGPLSWIILPCSSPWRCPAR
jgi:hypothetical protein